MSGHPFYAKAFSDAEKRYLPRWDVENRVRYKLKHESSDREGLTKDLSSTGICLKINDKMSVEQKVKLVVYLTEEKSLNVQGEVVWTRQVGTKTHVGINFSEIDEDAQELILKHAFEIEREKVLKHWYKGWDGKKEK